MRSKLKSLLCLIITAIFISCLVEKFIYISVGFDIRRALIVTIFVMISLSLFFYTVPKKNRQMINRYIDDTFSYRFLKKIFATNYIKITYSVIITLYTSLFLKNIYYSIIGICEICIITLLSNLIISKSNRLGKIINSLLMLLYNTNIIVLILGGTFVSMIMLTNLNSVEDLQGKAVIYIIGTILTIFFSLIPFKKIKISKKISNLYLLEISLYEIILIIIFGFSYSPLCNYAILVNNGISYYKLQAYINNTSYEENIFYKKEVKDYIKYDKKLTDKPNVIVIFTEGLSKHIIYDSRELMPNVRKLASKSIDFTSYYNHTAATYRGIIGQLYSGYQMENLDENHLISIQEILTTHNYNTAFINTEPNNPEFTNYLKSMNFNNLISDNKTNGIANSISDKDAYKLLFDSAIELNKKNKPFFLGIYTFGTHVSCDSIDKKFGDGTDNVLNKFYDLDYQFGDFIEKFNKSELFDNTIVIFTTDHASYTDYDYLRAFNGIYERKFSFLDEIPLYIYHKNVDVRKIDVSGRNSLDLAPTILDYIDISATNYFLGESLFSNNTKNRYDTIFTEGTRYLSSENEELKQIDIENKTIYEINGYLSLARKKD